MATVQSTYSERHTAGVAGLIASMHSFNADSKRVQSWTSETTPTQIPFGRAVVRGTSDDQVRMARTGNLLTASNFAGITVLDKTLRPEQEDRYVPGDVATILVEGDIWVTVSHAVNDGDDVTVDTDTGQFSSEAAASTTQVTIAGAKFLTTAAANGLAKLRLKGIQG